MFDGNKYLTRGVQSEIPVELQLFMWKCVLTLSEPVDYLQIFELSSCNGNQKIVHKQEQPEYSKEYILLIDNPVNAKVYVIDDGDYCTMLLAEEY